MLGEVEGTDLAVVRAAAGEAPRATRLPARTPATAPATNPTAAPTGPATAPSTAPAAAPPTAPTPLPPSSEEEDASRLAPSGLEPLPFFPTVRFRVSCSVSCFMMFIRVVFDASVIKGLEIRELEQRHRGIFSNREEILLSRYRPMPPVRTACMAKALEPLRNALLGSPCSIEA